MFLFYKCLLQNTANIECVEGMMTEALAIQRYQQNRVLTGKNTGSDGRRKLKPEWEIAVANSGVHVMQKS